MTKRKVAGWAIITLVVQGLLVLLELGCSEVGIQWEWWMVPVSVVAIVSVMGLVLWAYKMIQ